MAEEGTSEGADLESKIVEIMTKHPGGVSNAILQDAIPSMTVHQLVQSLNKLISQDKVQLLKKGMQLVYKLKTSGLSKQYQSADVEEKVVLEAVERAGNNGTTPKDIKFACNLPQPQVTKILKGLESKRKVKSVISATKKKVFMLYDLEPSRAVTGGTFYSGTDFESEFVDVLADQCYKYLLKAKAAADPLSDPISQRNASLKSSKEICDYIINLNISKVNLTVRDIENILDTLIYDDKVEKIVTVSGANTSKGETQNLYRVYKSLITSAALMRCPCGVCPVFKDCHPGGEISPSTCVYMKEWLEF